MKFIITEQQGQIKTGKYWLKDNFKLKDFELVSFIREPDSHFYKKGDRIVFEKNDEEKFIYYTPDIYFFLTDFLGLSHELVTRIMDDYVNELFDTEDYIVRPTNKDHIERYL